MAIFNWFILMPCLHSPPAEQRVTIIIIRWMHRKGIEDMNIMRENETTATDSDQVQYREKNNLSNTNELNPESLSKAVRCFIASTLSVVKP